VHVTETDSEYKKAVRCNIIFVSHTVVPYALYILFLCFLLHILFFTQSHLLLVAFQRPTDRLYCECDGALSYFVI